MKIDGGGVRGLSELLIIEEIMQRIKHDLDMDDDPLPADFFDLIGGTSTGGVSWVDHAWDLPYEKGSDVLAPLV